MQWSHCWGNKESVCLSVCLSVHVPHGQGNCTKNYKMMKIALYTHDYTIQVALLNFKSLSMFNRLLPKFIPK